MTPLQEVEQLRDWLKDESAVSLMVILGRVSQALDDIVDEEYPPLERSTILTDAMTELTLVMGCNAYWRANSTWLAPQVVRAFQDWHFSNECQRSKDPGRQLHGFIRREALDGIIAAIATQLHGPAHGREVMWHVHSFYHVEYGENETVETWVEEIKR